MIEFTETGGTGRGQSESPVEPEGGAPAGHKGRSELHGHNISDNVAGGGSGRVDAGHTPVGLPGDDVRRYRRTHVLLRLHSSRHGVSDVGELSGLQQRRVSARGHRTRQKNH